jgi:hypothetical protein
MAKKAAQGPGLAGHLLGGLAALAGDASQTVWNVSDRTIIGNRNLPLNQIRKVLVESKRVFLYDGNVVFEQHSTADGDSLVPLMLGDKLTPGAPAHLSNLFHCAVPGKAEPVTYQVPGKVISEVLHSEPTREQLPRIELYSRRPVFDKDFELHGPGFSAAAGILVHGEPAEPLLHTPPAAERALDRLPPGLKQVFEDFCFDTDADLVNALSVLLTGVLVNNFVDDGKPLFIHNGNQKGIGKTLLAQCYGLILDGTAGEPIQHSEDEDEMAKRLGARIKQGSPCSLLLFDNRRGTIGGGLLESLALAPRISVRRLGYNEDISRPNDLVWVFTANHARATPDITSRAVIVQLRYEGDPRVRFAGSEKYENKLKGWIRQHRQQLLGELIGMVVRWREAGKPVSPARHRATFWSEVIGGILQVAGLPEFLANQDEAALEVDEDLQDLIILAELAVGKNKPGFFTTAQVDKNTFGKAPKEWLPLFRDARLLQKELHESANDHAQTIAAGRFFGSRLGKTVPIQVGDKPARATLRVQPGRSRQRRYWFEITWEEAAPGQPEAGTASPSPATSAVPPAAVAPSGQGEDAGEGNASSPPASTTAQPALVGSSGNDLDWGEG